MASVEWQMSILDTQLLSHLGVSIGKYCLHLDFSIFQVRSSLYDLHSLRDPRNTFGLQSTQIFLVMEGVMLLKWKFIATDCCYLPVASLSSVPLISGSPSLRDRCCLVEMCRGHTLEAGSSSSPFCSWLLLPQEAEKLLFCSHLSFSRVAQLVCFLELHCCGDWGQERKIS